MVEFLLKGGAFGFPDLLAPVPILVGLSAEAFLLFFFAESEEDDFVGMEIWLRHDELVEFDDERFADAGAVALVDEGRKPIAGGDDDVAIFQGRLGEFAPLFVAVDEVKHDPGAMVDILI